MWLLRWTGLADKKLSPSDDLLILKFSSYRKGKVCAPVLSPVQFCATPWMDCSSPGSSLSGISLARTLEWVAISFLKGF